MGNIKNQEARYADPTADTPNGEELEKQLSQELEEVFGARVDGNAVDEIYMRKVYVINKVMNEHIGMGSVSIQRFKSVEFSTFASCGIEMRLLGIELIMRAMGSSSFRIVCFMPN